MEPGEAFTKLLGEDVPSGAGPLPQLDEGGTGCFSHPQKSIQPVGRPASGHQRQRGKKKKRSKLEEQHQCTEAEAEEKYDLVHLDSS